METPEKVVVGSGTLNEYTALVFEDTEVRWYAHGRVTVVEGGIEKTVYILREQED